MQHPAEDADGRVLQRRRNPNPPRLLVQMRRAYLWICAAGCAAGALLLAETLGRQSGAAVPAGLFAALAAAGAAAATAPVRWLGPLGTAEAIAITLAMAGTTLMLGWGTGGPGLMMVGLIICALCAAVGWRAGAALAAVSGAAVLVLALVAPTPVIVAPDPAASALRLGLHLVAIGAGLACGVMVSQLLGAYMRRAREREQRFRSLLALAADGYWEVDREHRLTAGAGRNGEMRPLAPDEGRGRMPWELPQFRCDPESLDLLRAEMDGRRTFRDQAVQWQPHSAPQRTYLVSGEPRYDDSGVFCGYWGMLRDVTAVHAAQQALQATESRYRGLFSRIPTPLVLHRAGRVIDANPAAVGLFGHADIGSMVGSELLEAYEAGDSRERARRRIELLSPQKPGAGLPVTGFRLHVHGRVISVRATSVQVDAGGSAAMLSIFLDDTERLAAEDAVRRSEALLSHLVATSPDVISLTELHSGRYTMVNDSFERVFGWHASEAVGRTSADLGIWADGGSRDRLLARLQAEGSVTDLPAQFIAKSGKPVEMVLSAARFVMDHGAYLVVTARDVTQRERQRLEREAILANAPIGIAVTRQQRFVLANPHFERIYGWPPGSLAGQPSHVVWHGAAEHAVISAEAGPRLLRGEPVEFERTARRQDGSTFTAQVRGHAIDPGRPLDGGTVWLVEDVTGRRLAEQALARARDDAEAANRAKSAFLANTSHELRTPLNGMIGLARLAADETLADDRRRQYLDQLEETAHSLADIISDILDVSKIEAGKLQLEQTTFDLGALLNTLHASYGTLAAAHGLTLRLDVPATAGGPVVGDPLRVRQIVSNFLTNAIKFTPSGGIELRARRLHSGATATVRLEVVDSGPGIDAPTRQRLFQPFTQGDDSTTRRFGGTGLGLSICRELAMLMGGSVGVDSRPGAGSTFWAELPLQAAAAVAPAAPRPLAPGGLRGVRVLIAEDNPVNMMIAVAMLEKWGIVVSQATDGQAAVSSVQRSATEGCAPDAVLMDVQMPVMSGHEATRALRKAGFRMPIVALTAAALVTERDAALAAGMNDFLTKPVDRDKLQAALLRWCAPDAETVIGIDGAAGRKPPGAEVARASLPTAAD